ncbi:TAXI family TRAP transporter solute-binding subunit [Cognatishimia sp. F0-27]|uniref:TAXI family TRAP transporter solute-binding subunit n=1 Tax=Cognatishimia sp. F0-27 TaxID=2816855 RepID=UPI001D0CB4DB|nr:TAXI family TRAP transporter solute-binding subunit [Cognatishimia sp. F0-27]MCC1495033.1 TAXI family TRAP transporter solute-binding subunit [Cognatishimia sp. F0-27]
MKMRHLMVGAAIAVMGAGPVMAEIAALGSTQRGGTSQIGRALAAAISENSDIQMRPQELANTADYMPLVNAGELEFGISNVVQLTYAVNGTGMSEGRPLPDLQMVATLMPFRTSYIVRADSEYQSIEDLKGARAPLFADGALGDFVTRGYLATEGMTPDDMQGVQVPNFPRMWASFAEGSTDVTIVVVGAANSREFDATFGIRYIGYDDSAESLAAMQEWLPQSYFTALDADSGIPGIDGPTNVVAYDYTLFASADAPEDMVYRATKALFEATPGLLETGGPVWAGFSTDVMSKDVGVAYHPGAMKFYEEMGMWER